MNVARAVTAVVGVALAAVGVVLLFSPSMAAAIPVQTLGMTIVVLLAFGQMLRVFVGWVARGRDHRTLEPNEAETVPAGPTPGEDFDRLLDQTLRSSDPGSQRTQRERVLWRLREAAVAALERRGHDTPTAIEMVEDGSWTDNEVAAWIFSDEDRELRAQAGWRGYLGLTNTPKQSFVRAASEACYEIAALTGVEVPEPGAGSVPGRGPDDGDDGGPDSDRTAVETGAGELHAGSRRTGTGDNSDTAGGSAAATTDGGQPGEEWAVGEHSSPDGSAACEEGSR